MRARYSTVVSGPDRKQRRLELIWTWLAFATLILCWDASARLETRVSPPRVRIAHAGERDEAARTIELAGAQ